MTDRYSNLDSDGSFDGEYSEDYHEDDVGFGAPEQESVQEFQQEQNWDEEAKLDYKTVVILAQKTIRPRDLIRNYDSKNPTDETKWELRNGGKVPLTFADGSLSIESGNKEDFKEAIRQWNQKSSSSSGGRQQQQQQKNYTDLIKSVKIEAMTSNWEKTCVLELNTIPAFQDDFNYGKSGNVIFTFLQGQLSQKPSNFTILDRTITKGNMAFQKQFPGATHSNIESTMIPYGEKFYIVPFNGMLHAFHNRDLPAGKKITSPTTSLGAGQNQVIELTREEGNAALEKAKQKLGNTVSLGDVTNNFKVSLFAKPNGIRLAQDLKWKETKGAEGKEWRSFADAFNVIPKATEAERANFMENHYDFQFKFIIKYLKQA